MCVCACSFRDQIPLKFDFCCSEPPFPPVVDCEPTVILELVDFGFSPLLCNGFSPLLISFSLFLLSSPIPRGGVGGWGRSACAMVKVRCGKAFCKVNVTAELYVFKYLLYI